MAARIWNVQVHHPGPAAGESRDHYWAEGLGSRLAGLYGDLLDMHLIDIGYKKLARDGDPVQIGFEHAPHDPPPTWGDPDRPQQAHLDIEVADLHEAEAVARRWGATPLLATSDHRVFADAFGHPFCLYTADDRPEPGRIARVVFDCFSPRALAAFWGDLLAFDRRVHDTPERVVIAGDDPTRPMLAFQHAQFAAARWPDPAYPAQLHLDLDGDAALAVRLGAIPVRGPDGRLKYADPAAHPFCLGD